MGVVEVKNGVAIVELKPYKGNGGFSDIQLTLGTSFYRHKKGVVGIKIGKKGAFQSGTKEVLASFIYKNTEYLTGFEEVKSKRSLGLRLDRFVKKSIELSEENNFHCQYEEEQGECCDKQCEHCKEYYKGTDKGC